MDKGKLLKIIVIIVIILAVIFSGVKIYSSIDNNHESDDLSVEIYMTENSEYLNTLQVVNYFNTTKYEDTPLINLYIKSVDEVPTPTIKLIEVETGEVLRESDYVSIEDIFAIIEGGKHWNNIVNKRR